MSQETQTAYAKSVFIDPLTLVNFVALALTLPEINAVVPTKYAPLVAAVIALANLVLRMTIVNHPVAAIAPGEVKPVEVKRLEATKRGSEDLERLPTNLGGGQPNAGDGQ